MCGSREWDIWTPGRGLTTVESWCNHSAVSQTPKWPWQGGSTCIHWKGGCKGMSPFYSKSKWRRQKRNRTHFHYFSINRKVYLHAYRGLFEKEFRWVGIEKYLTCSCGTVMPLLSHWAHDTHSYQPETPKFMIFKRIKPKTYEWTLQISLLLVTEMEWKCSHNLNFCKSSIACQVTSTTGRHFLVTRHYASVFTYPLSQGCCLSILWASVPIIQWRLPSGHGMAPEDVNVWNDSSSWSF